MTNGSDMQLSYDLEDTLGLPQGVTISDQTVEPDAATAAQGVAANPLWNGIDPATSVVDDQTIAADKQHVFVVTAVATPGPDFDLDDALCDDGPGQGLFNGAVMTSGGIPDEGEACADLPVAKLTLVKTVDNSEFPEDLDGHTLATVENWKLTATNEAQDATITGISKSAAVTSVLVPAGEYVLSEEDVQPPNTDLLDYYTAGDWDCLDGADVLAIEPGDNVTCEIVNTGHPVDLSIDKDDNGVVIDQGDSYAYTFTVKNNGEVSAKDVVVTDPIPATLKVDMGSIVEPLGWGPPSLDGEDGSGFGGVLTFTKPLLAPDDTQVITFEVTSSDSLPRDPADTGKILDIVNTTEVTSGGVELDPSDNHSEETTPVKSIAIDINGICVKNAPYANYSITPYNADPANTVSIIWWTQDAYDDRDESIPAADVAAILADGALQVDVLPAPQGGWTSGTEVEGTQLWAGASVDPVTKVGTAWPGYALVNGVWKLDPASKYYPIRDSALIEVRMNPSTGDTVGYPPLMAGCRPFNFPDLPTLALTGAGFAGAWVFGSGLFLLLGALMVVLNRRKDARHRA